MNAETFLWIMVYSVWGLIVLSIAAAVIAHAVKSVHPEISYTVTMDVPGEREDVHLEATVPGLGDVRALVGEWAPSVIRPGGIKDVPR